MRPSLRAIFFVITILLMPLLPGRSLAQRSPLDSAGVLVKRGTEALGGRTPEDYRRAAALLTEAREQYRVAGQPGGEALALYGHGSALRRLDRDADALPLLREGYLLASDPQIRRIRALLAGELGEAHHDLGRPDSALHYFREAALPSGAGVGPRWVRMGNAHREMGAPDSAVVYHRRALESFRASGRREMEGVALNNLAFAFYSLGRPDSARAYLEASREAMRGAGFGAADATLLGNTGKLYDGLGRSDSALVFFGRSLEAARAAGSRDDEADALTWLGEAHHHLGRLDSAAIYYRRSLALRASAPDQAGEAVTRGNLGIALVRLGEADSARAHFAAVLRTQRARGDRRGEAAILDNLARLEDEAGRADSALALLRRSLALRTDTRDRGGEAVGRHNLGALFLRRGEADSARAQLEAALAIAREVRDPRTEAGALESLAVLHARSERAADDARALAYLDSAAAVRGALGAHAGGDWNRVSFGEANRALFETWALLWLRPAPETGEGAAVRASLAAGERGRAQALLDLMRAAPAEPPRAGRDLAAEGDSLVAALRRTGATTLSYLATPDVLLVWLLPASGEPEVHRVEISADSLAALVAAYRSELGADDAAAGTRMAGGSESERRTRARSRSADGRGDVYTEDRLAAVLLPPELRAKLPAGGELVVVPSGALGLVSFAALPLGGEPLGARFAVRYAPSLRALLEAEARPEIDRAAFRQALVVGNPAMPTVEVGGGRRRTLAPLPKAGAEAAAVAEVLRAPFLAGDQAGEETVRRLLPAAPLVHLATHGYAYGTDALSRASFVALAPGGGHDGVLSVGEVVDDLPRLRAELVVLSACQTGLGSIKEAEGTVGLQRAFLGKGARSVLVSLWSVSDEATGRLMEGFYAHWLGDADRPGKAEALRRAQEELRNTPGFEDPLYWAGFQLVGAG